MLIFSAARCYLCTTRRDKQDVSVNTFHFWYLLSDAIIKNEPKRAERTKIFGNYFLKLVELIRGQFSCQNDRTSEASSLIGLTTQM